MNKVAVRDDCRWILLIQQLPPKPVSLRVKTWRRLQNIGALALKNSVYMLPFTKETYEDFQWLRKEIIALNGQAMISKVDFMEGFNNQEIIRQFRKMRDNDYLALISDIMKFRGKVSAAGKRKKSKTPHTEDYEVALSKFNACLNKITSRDYFHASQKRKAEKMLHDCGKLIKSFKRCHGKALLAKGTGGAHTGKRYHNKVWITRQGLHVDRIASAWLIKRFIDRGARFRFVPEGETKVKGVGFDLYDTATEFTHRRGDCTFETLMKSFCLKEAALRQIAEIVHDIDLKDKRFGREEAEGINKIIIGLSQKLKNDRILLQQGMAIFDSLYHYYSSQKPEKR